MIKYQKNKGATLLEILIAIAILSILIVTSYYNMPRLLNLAYDALRKSDLDKIKNNLEVYFSVAEQYPEKLPGCGQPLMYKTFMVLNKTPCDPVTKKAYYYQIKEQDLRSYRLYTILSNNQDSSIAKTGCLGGCGQDCLFNYGVSSANTNLIRCSYVCAPGGGTLGSCEIYQDTVISQCPKTYEGDSTCNKECNTPKNRCKNASGKHVPN